MTDDITSADFNVDAAVARTRKASQATEEQAFKDGIGIKPTANPAIAHWVRNLPKNVGMATYRAALNTIEAADDIFAEAGSTPNADEMFADNPLMTGGGPAPGGAQGVAPLREMFPGFFESAHQFADEAEANNTLGDDLTQGIAQFAIPFAGWLKGLGGLKKMSAAAKVAKATAAEAGATSTAFAPDDGRLADLAKMGVDAENRLGEVMRKVSPDGSLTNAYIDWMTTRGESKMQERFKNVVDGLVGSAAIGSVLKSAGVSMKGGKKILNKAAAKQAKEGSK